MVNIHVFYFYEKHYRDVKKYQKNMFLLKIGTQIFTVKIRPMDYIHPIFIAITIVEHTFLCGRKNLP